MRKKYIYIKGDGVKIQHEHIVGIIICSLIYNILSDFLEICLRKVHF